MNPPIRSGIYRSNKRVAHIQRALAAIVLIAFSTHSLAQSPAPERALSPGATGALPALGDNSDLTALKERRLGDRIAHSIYRDTDYVDDPVLDDYLQSIWQPLLAAARVRGELAAELDERFAWQLFLIRDRSINAFALPGGYFGVHLGLIANVDSADELAAVLAHELSHVTQRHISRLLTQQTRQTPLLLAAMLLGMLAASKNPQAGSAAIVGGQALAAQGQLNFARDRAREADRVGFGVMTDAGYSSSGVSSMFEKLQQASRMNDNGLFPYLRSHPLTTERIAEARARVQLVSPASPAFSTAPDAKTPAKPADDGAAMLHAMMAARARVLAPAGVDTLRTLVAEAQRQPAASAGARSAGALYAGALAAAQLREFASAKSLLARLMPVAADRARAAKAAALLAIEVDLLEGKVSSTAASADIGKAASRGELLLQARSLLAAGRAADVSQALQTWVAVHPRDAAAWQTLAVAYGQQNQPLRAIRADAESHAAQLDYAGALDRFKAAQGLVRGNPAGADHVEGSIVDTRARQVELILKEQALQDKIDR